MDRRRFLIGGAAAAAATPAFANVPAPYDWDVSPPRESREAFVEWMVKNRGEDPRFLGSAGTASSRSSRTTTSGTKPTSAPIS